MRMVAYNEAPVDVKILKISSKGLGLIFIVEESIRIWKIINRILDKKTLD
jgi:hypothetical protein